jgi:glycerol-3-phosphate dehydrogenase (NAD(P)+)
MLADRENVRFLPDFKLPENLLITSNVTKAVSGAEIVLVVAPMRSLAENLAQIKDLLPDRAVLVSGVKGLDIRTGKRVSQIVEEALGERAGGGFATISGPNLALEVAAREPTTTVVASSDRHVAERVQRVFTAPWFRSYTSGDVVGVELAGALKNIVALGAGMSDGLGFGSNARASLMTRGLAEITRLGVVAGADPLTFGGLAGVGDLVATCSSARSRNHHVGHELALGRPLDEITAEMSMVAEGVDTTRGALALAERLGVEMPITEGINEVLRGVLSAEDGVTQLMSRPAGHELQGISLP